MKLSIVSDVNHMEHYVSVRQSVALAKCDV